MFKMTFAWLAVYWGGLIASFVSPVYGLLIYLFEYYLRPSLHWWGRDLPRWRYSLIVSIVLVVSYMMTRTHLPEQRFKDNPALKWLLFFGANMLLVTPLAVNAVENWKMVTIFWKVIALYGFIIAIVRTEWAFNAFVAMHIAGAGWWGWEAYLDPERRAGRLMNVGSSDTLNDNQAAGHLLTVLPFVLLFAFRVKDKRLKALAIVAGPLIVNTFILCNSRGATIAMLVALGSTLLLAKKGHRMRMGLAGVGVLAMFFMLADSQFIMRQQTTINYEEESTAQGRMSNWSAGMRLLQDRPMGAGGYGYNHLSPIYVPEVTAHRNTGRVSPHNTWVLVATEWGVQGFVLFLGLLAATFRMLHRIRRETSDVDMYYRSAAVQVALIGTLTAATFSDRLYGESVYWMCALAVVLYRLHLNAEAPVIVTVEEPQARPWRPAATAGAA